jgi:uncharacterized protein (UPF0335 family)
VTIGRKRQDTERDRLAEELAGLRADIKELRAEKDSTGQLTKLRRDVETLKLEKDRLEETNARKVREVEHKTGLLRTQQEHEVANARRETELQVREENLKADKKRFEDEMKFQRDHLQREVGRIEDILGKILERLPVIDVSLNGAAGTRKSRSASEQ